ncbi:MAG: glycosyltransferase [Verrucomicrobiota bacterium]
MLKEASKAQDERDSVLVLTNDLFTPASKTSRFISLALRRLGIRNWVRDTSDIRYLFSLLEEHQLTKHIGASEMIHVDRFQSLVNLAEIKTILSLDLHWFFTPEPFVSMENVDKIISLWFDDLRTACTTSQSIKPADRSFQETLTHPKVHHMFYGNAQMDEAKELGITNRYHSPLAAPQEYLSSDSPLKYRGRLAFVGNPGIPSPPSAEALKLLHKKADLTELRKASIQEIESQQAYHHFNSTHRDIPKLISRALECKLAHPHKSSLSLLCEVGKEYPEALEALNNSRNILEAAILVKCVNRYDRPAIVFRLYQQDKVDVFSAPWEWKPYGIQAKPLVRFHDLPQTYRSYVAQLNGANPARDATANEKLFEIAACGRASINISSPDILECFEHKKEFLSYKSLEEIEENALYYLKNPDELLQIGENARARVAKQHTWDHRLQTILEKF